MNLSFLGLESSFPFAQNIFVKISSCIIEQFVDFSGSFFKSYRPE